MLQSAAPFKLSTRLLMPSKNRISVNLKEHEYSELAALAKNSNVSMAWIGRIAISQLIQNNADNDAQLPLLNVTMEKEASS
jgi:hypothetical protein